MAFYVVEVDNEGFKVYDSAGNAIDPAKDSSVQSVLTALNAIKNTDGIRKIVDALPAGTNNIGDVDVLSSALPTGAATETTLLSIKAKTDNIPSDPAREGGKLTSLETILTAIRDTAGVKKITDALPTGYNIIGRAKLTDGTNVVDVIDDGGVKRLRVDAKIVTGGASQDVRLVDGEGNELSLEDASTILASQSGIIVAGKDGTTARFLATDSAGRLITSPPGSNSLLRGFSDGKAVLTASALAPVRFTTYTEQTSNAQRSIASSSANDTAAGTGARTVKITYYSVTAGVVTGPFTETVTLNGTSYVNTVSTTIAFIEKIEVLTIGSGLTNAGILTLKAATAGGGATIVTIGAGDGQTFLGHHYVASGRTMKLTDVSTGIKGADAASFLVKVDDPTTATSFERQVSDIIRIGTNQSTIIRPYGTPIEIPGPAHVQLYVQPDSTSSRTYYAAMDYFEE